MFTKLQTWIKTQPLDVALLVALGLVGLWSGWQARHIIADDAMITFRVSENLAYGRGFVYNVGERVQVTTTPLYAMLVAAGVWVFGSAPVAALVLNITLAMLIPMLAYDLGRRLSGRITGLTGALLLSLMPLLVIAFSMESYLYVALALAALNAYAARRYLLAGLLTGATVMMRGDAVLVGACLLTYDFLTTRRLRWRLIIPAIAIPAGWYLFATVYYGSPFPATLQAKTAQGKINWLGDYFISGFYHYWKEWIRHYTYAFFVFPVLYVLGLIAVIRRERQWLVVVARDLLYVALFEGLQVTFAAWYYAPITPGPALLIGRGVQLVVELVVGATRRWLPAVAARRHTDAVVASAAVVGFAILLTQTVYPVTRAIIAANPDWKALAYPPAARWLVANTSASATLATIDIGHLGYWSGRRIIDIVGLAQPDVAAHIAEGDFGYAIREHKPDLVVVGALWLPEIQGAKWFQQDYAMRHSLQLDGMAEPLLVFSRRTGIKVNTESAPAAAIIPINADFNRQITLTGATFNRPAAPNTMLNVTLFWQAVAPVANDFTVFVQLVDANRRIVAQSDGQPQQGFYATPNWQPGERITDLHLLPLPLDILPGTYDLLIGLYEAGSGARLQILDSAGQFQSDYVKIPGVVIAP